MNKGKILNRKIESIAIINMETYAKVFNNNTAIKGRISFQEAYILFQDLS